MKRGKPIARKKGLNPVNRKRRKKNSARAYGPKERREWVKTLHCRVAIKVFALGGFSPCSGDIDQAHVGNGGMSRKADASWVFPCCNRHHRLLHDAKLPWVSRADMERWAYETEAAWRDYCTHHSLRTEA